jgi:Interferon-induced transmembrane protein/zinc-ribbon domain
MYCTHCGTQRPPGAATCPSCGHAFSVPAEVKNYLVQAILCTLCCCLPFGIAALVYSTQVNGKLAAGDLAGAQTASDRARMWCWIALIAGVITGAGASLIAFL